MANNLEQIDTTSVAGTLITIGSATLSMLTLEDTLKVVALCVTIVAGVTTIWYNIIKIKKSNDVQS